MNYLELAASMALLITTITAMSIITLSVAIAGAFSMLKDSSETWLSDSKAQTALISLTVICHSVVCAGNVREKLLYNIQTFPPPYINIKKSLSDNI